MSSQRLQPNSLGSQTGTAGQWFSHERYRLRTHDWRVAVG